MARFRHTCGVISLCCFLCLLTLSLCPMSRVSSTTLLHFFVLLSVFYVMVFHPCESFVLPRAFFVLFRSSIRSDVSQEIHLSLLVPLHFPNIFAALSLTPPTNICHCSSRSVECSRAANMFLVSMRKLSDAVCSLKLKFRKYPSIHTNYIISHSTILQYNHTIKDTVVTQKRNIEHEKQ